MHVRRAQRARRDVIWDMAAAAGAAARAVLLLLLLSHPFCLFVLLGILHVGLLLQVWWAVAARQLRGLGASCKDAPASPASCPAHLHSSCHLLQSACHLLHSLCTHAFCLCCSDLQPPSGDNHQTGSLCVSYNCAGNVQRMHSRQRAGSRKFGAADHAAAVQWRF